MPFNDNRDSNRDVAVINQVLLEITSAVHSSKSLSHLFETIHQTLERIIDVSNFFIAIVDTKERTLHFPYYVDTVDDDFSPIKNFDPDSSLTGLVVSQGEPILLKSKDLEKRATQNGIWGPVPMSWMGAPLIIDDEIIGVIAVQSYSDANLYNNQDLRILSAISGQVALAIHRKRAEYERERSLSLLEATLESTADGILVVDNNGKWTNFNKKFIDIWELPSDLVEGDNDDELKTYVMTTIAESEGFPTKVRDLSSDSETHSFDMVELKDGKIFECYSQPQRIGEEIVGRVWSFRDITERNRIENALRDSEEISQVLLKIASAVHNTENLRQLYKSIHHSLSRLMDLSNFFIALYDRTKNTIDFEYFVDQFDKALPRIESVTEVNSLTGEVIIKKRPLLLNEAMLLDRAQKSKIVGTTPKIWLGVPLNIKDEVIGVVAAQSYSDANLYDDKDLQVLAAISDQIALAIHRKRAENELRVRDEKLSHLSDQTEQLSMAAASMISIQDEQQFFNKISKAIVDFSDYKRVLISLFKKTPPYREIIAYGGVEEEVVDRLRKVDMPKSWYDKVFVDENLIGHYSYYIPYTKKNILNQEATIYGSGPVSDQDRAFLLRF